MKLRRVAYRDPNPGLSELAPPSDATVTHDPDQRIVLFDAHDRPLVRPIGFRPATRKGDRPWR